MCSKSRNKIESMKSILLFIPILILTGNSFGQINCDTLHTGTFLYLDVNDKEVYVVIQDDIHTEYYDYGKFFIQSKLEWTDNCGYIATLEKSSLPNFPAKKGDKMITRFIRTEDNNVIYESTVLNRTWEGALFKIEKLPAIIKP